MKLAILFMMPVLIFGLQPTASPQTVLQGGDNINNAFPIYYVPFSDNGTTLGYIDDYTGNCGPSYGAPDVVYSFAPTTDMVIMASLCQGSDFDTRLYVFENSPNIIIACNDDYCSNQYSDYISAIPCLELYAGNTYYFVIDGYGSARGNYTFTLTLPTPGVAITGVVTESGDGPLSGVNVRVLMNGTQVWQDTTSTLGIYDVIYLAPGTYTVEASKAGYVTQTSDPVFISTCQNAHVDFVLEQIPPPPPIGIIEGVVTGSDGMTPIDSAVVVAVPQPNQGGFITTDTTNDQGHFRLPDMQTVLYDVTASRAGYISQTQYNVMVYSDQTTIVDFALERVIPPPIGSLAGVVRFLCDSSLVEGAIVTANPIDGGIVYTDTTGPDGSYLMLEMQTLLYDVTAFKAGYMPQTQHNIQILSDSTIQLDLMLLPPIPGCTWVLGDINNDGHTNGVDVIYGVNYFKNGVPPPPFACVCLCSPPWFVAGDVNGSCTFNGLDITYMVSYYKGGPPFIPCPDCPPPGR